MEEEGSKYCIQCNKILVGRTDKKFCSNKCRANYFYKEKSEYTKFKKQVHAIIQNNRDILAELNPDGKTSVQKNLLVDKKFDFRYFTSVYKAKNGNIYWFCYDQGYRKLQKRDTYLLVKWQSYMV